MESLERSERYGDWTPVEAFGESGRMGTLRPFYGGPSVEGRMHLIRQAIEEMRRRWDEYPAFMANLREVMRAGRAARGCGDVRDDRSEALFASRIDWLDHGARRSSGPFDAIALYTSHDGYNDMFRTINLGLRRDDLFGQRRALRAAVFLIELLTIDLFNYCRTNGTADQFEGHVYRGMCVTEADLARFRSAVSSPIAERYVSVPLAMVSASRRPDIAEDFALRTARSIPGGRSVLWNVHAASLDPALLAVYAEHVPQSVVSSICAVPISELSDYPAEEEVLLRGPFFQLLGMRHDEGPASPVRPLVLDVLMLTANRDHLSTVHLDARDAEGARQLFRTVVALDRARHCRAYAERHDRPDDVAAYGTMLAAQEAQLGELVG